MVRFADRIRYLRDKKELNQSELAKDLGVNNTAISKWELGERFPDEDMLIKISEYFGVTRGYLLGDEQEYSSKDICNYNYIANLLDQLISDGLITKDNIPEYILETICSVIKIDLAQQDKNKK